SSDLRSPLQVPPASSFVDAQSIAPWLQQAYEALATSPSVLSRVAAVGMLGRLWTPGKTGTLSLDQLLAMRLPGPSGRAWLQAQPLALREEVVAEAIATSSLLRVAFGEIGRAHV